MARGSLQNAWNAWAPSQYPKRRLSVRSRKVSKPWDLYLELCDRSEIWQALRQQCCRCACQMSKRYDNLKYQSRGFETLRDLTKRRLFGYWDGAQWPACYGTERPLCQFEEGIPKLELAMRETIPPVNYMIQISMICPNFVELHWMKVTITPFTTCSIFPIWMELSGKLQIELKWHYI